MRYWALAGYLIGLVALLASILLGWATQPVFWALYAMTVLFLSVHIARSGKAGLLLLIIFDLFVFFIFALQFPGFYQVDRDSGFETSYAEEIALLGHWDPHGGNGYAEDYYGYNPLLHFILAFLTLVTGVSAHVFGKWGLMIFFRILFMALSFRILELMTRERRIALLSLLVFVITPRLRVLFISRRLVAAICILFALYALLMYREGDRRWAAVSIVSSCLVVMADHTLALMYGLFLLGYLLFYQGSRIVFRMRKSLVPLLLFLSFALTWIAWNGVLSPTTLEGDASYIDSIMEVFGRDGPVGSVGTTGSGQGTYSSYENLLIMGSQAALFLAAGVGVLWMLFRKQFSWDIITYWTLISIPMAALFTYLISTKWVVLSNVTLWFFLLPLSAVCGMLLAKCRGIWWNGAGLVFLLVLFTGGMLLTYHPNVLFSDGGKALIESPEYKDGQIFASAEWLSQDGDQDGVVIGDRSVFDIYSAYFGFEVTPVDVTEAAFLSNRTELEKRFLTREIYFGSYTHTSGAAIPRYLVVNRDLISHDSYFFTMRQEDLSKFDSSGLLQKVYDNGKIAIYENRYKMSASLG